MLNSFFRCYRYLRDENAPRKIEDPNAVIPDDWLEEEEALIPDPEAVKPSDWDDSMDGEWEAPKIDNPKCKGRSGCGKWTKPMIDNPNHKVSFEDDFSLTRTCSIVSSLFC